MPVNPPGIREKDPGWWQGNSQGNPASLRLFARQDLGGAGRLPGKSEEGALGTEQAAKSEVLWRVHLWVGLWAHGSMSLQQVAGRKTCEREITLEEQREGLERLGQKKSPKAAASV